MYNRKNPRLLPAAIALLLFTLPLLLASCNSGSGTAEPAAQAKTDTGAPVATAQKVLKFHSLQTTNGLLQAAQRIDPVLVNRRAGINNLYPVVVDANGNPVSGFSFKASDYQDMTALHPASLYFEFGVTNVDDSTAIANHTKKADYTIMVIPLDANGKQLSDATGLVAYDYVCPCVKNVGCCPAQ